MIPSYKEIVDFTASPQARDNVALLIEREKAGTITLDERAELNHYLEVEHLMRLAKGRARQKHSQ